MKRVSIISFLICIGLLIGCIPVDEYVVTGVVYEIEVDGSATPISGVIVSPGRGTSDTTDVNGAYEVNTLTNGFYANYNPRPYKDDYETLDSVSTNTYLEYDFFIKANPSFLVFLVETDITNADSVVVDLTSEDRFQRNNRIVFKNEINSSSNRLEWNINSDLEDSGESVSRERASITIEIGAEKEVTFSYQAYDNGIISYEKAETFSVEKTKWKLVDIKRD